MGIGSKILVGGAIGGGILGAAGGAFVAGQSDMDAKAGAVVGGAVGAAALPVATGTAYGVGMATPSALAGIGTVAGGIAAGVGTAAFAAPGLAAKTAAVSAVPMMGILGNAMFDYIPKTGLKDAKGKALRKEGFKMKFLGKALFTGGALMTGTKKAIEKSEGIRMGQMDPYITRAAPRIPMHQDNAGATGDLVFALNANRRG